MWTKSSFQRFAETFCLIPTLVALLRRCYSTWNMPFENHSAAKIEIKSILLVLLQMQWCESSRSTNPRCRAQWECAGKICTIPWPVPWWSQQDLFQSYQPNMRESIQKPFQRAHLRWQGSRMSSAVKLWCCKKQRNTSRQDPCSQQMKTSDDSCLASEQWTKTQPEMNANDKKCLSKKDN